MILFNRYRGLAGRPAPNLENLPEQIVESDIDAIVDRRAVCIYYQHLGVARKNNDGSFDAAVPPYFSPAALAPLRHISARQRSGDCLVAGLARLLRYLEVRDALRVSEQGGLITLSCNQRLVPEDLTGITVHVPVGIALSALVVRAGDEEYSVPFRRERLTSTPFDVVHVPWTQLDRGVFA